MMPEQTEAQYDLRKEAQTQARTVDIPNLCKPSRQHILSELFTYHPVREDQAPKYTAIRSAAKYFAEVLLANTPSGADQSAAIRKVREAVMTANAAISLDGLNL